MEVKVKFNKIDYCIQRPDALLVYMVDGKVWVCDKNQKMPQSKDELFVTLKLKTDSKKGKCGR